MIASTNPTTGQRLRTFEESNVELALQKATHAFTPFRQTSFLWRRERMMRVAELLLSRRDHWAGFMTLEMGKPRKAAVAEIEKSAWACRFYAENAEVFLKDEPIVTEASSSFIRWLPLGPLLAVMPWNFPFWQVFRFVAPALMAGNTVLLKHASNVPQCALAIEEIISKEFPEGVFQTLLIGADKVANLIQDERIFGVTLTGSEGAGMQVGMMAGKHLKKSVLELGGSDPFIVMPSADLEMAAKTAVKARIVNAGQSCIAAKRFIVHENVYNDFENKLMEGFKNLKLDLPEKDDTEMGPLATKSVLDEVDAQVRDAVSQGAKIFAATETIREIRRQQPNGFFYPPTILSGLSDKMRVFHEEVFGPVALLFKVRSIDEAIAIANNHKYGLGSSVWTHSTEEQQRFINDLQAGMTYVNTMVVSDVRLPFGGVKSSGYGRELGKEGIREFVNAKSVWITK